MLISLLSTICVALATTVFLMYRRNKKSIHTAEKDKSNLNIVTYGDSDELNERYLVDFRADRFTNFGETISFFGTNNIEINGESEKTKELKKLVRVEVKPIEVLKELSRPPTKWSLEGIDDKIRILKDKEKLIEQRFAREEVKGLIVCLENRKKFDCTAKSGKTFREFFSQFDTTDEEKIEALLKKYTLKRGSADIFIPEFPDSAIKIMKEYKAYLKELCNKEPRFYVIAQEKDFEKQDKKRDPILLTQSPFGFYYCILGAWDTEMIYLPEL